MPRASFSLLLACLAFSLPCRSCGRNWPAGESKSAERAKRSGKGRLHCDGGVTVVAEAAGEDFADCYGFVAMVG